MTYRSKWIQRDLEDQIAEEYKKQGKEYHSLIQKEKTMAREIKLSEVVSLLKQGYTRWTKEENVDGEGKADGKSIQTHYDLTFSECKTIFAHPKVKGIKTKKLTITLVDDTESPKVAPVERAQAPTTLTEAIVLTGETTPVKEETLEDKFEDLFK